MCRGLILSCCFLFLTTLIVGQEDAGVKFNIDVKHKSSPYLKGLVKVYKNNSFLDQVPVNNEGHFTYLMPYGFVYQLHFTGEGMATKILELDLISNVPESEKNSVYDWSIGEIELFKAYKEIELEKLEKPIARIHFEVDIAELSIDYKYTGKRKKELASLETQVEKLEKQEAVQEKEDKKQYELLVTQGNEALNNKQFEKAKERFEQAILLKEEGEAKEKLLAINKVLKREDDYKNLLIKAKTLKDQGELQQASEIFIAASALKPENEYPKQQVALISQEIKAEEQKANAFNNYIAVANRAYESGNFEAAAANYNKALDLNPDAVLASKKLELSEQKLKAKENAEAEDEKFNKLLVEAKNARARGDLENATLLLNEAESVKPSNEQLIAEKATVQSLLVAEKKKEEDAKTLAMAAEKEKEEQYGKYIELAQNSEREGNTKEALFFYKKANGYKSNSPEVEEKIAALSAAPVGATPVVSSPEPSSEIDKMDKKSPEFQSKLATMYPQGKTVNKSSKGNKTITQVIIVEGNKGTEYQQIKYNWGGIYFFRNGDPISKLIWDKETR